MTQIYILIYFAFFSYTPPSAKYEPEVYKNQPRRISEYEPGQSSLAETEAMKVK